MNFTSDEASNTKNSLSSLIFCLFFFCYLISWLSFLSYRHYGSARSAHIFELNVLFDFSLFFGSLVFEGFLSMLSEEPGPLLCSLMMIPQHVTTLFYYSAIAASHLETLMFLKVCTMMCTDPIFLAQTGAQGVT